MTDALISSLTKTECFKIYNITGAKVNNGTFFRNEKIDIQKQWVEFYKFEDDSALNHEINKNSIYIINLAISE